MSHIITLHNNQPTVSHRVIAENTGNQEASIRNLINKHILDFEEFGKAHFKNVAIKNAKNKANEVKTFLLNEQQATLLMTYLKNSSLVRAFKVALVKEFYKLREELYQKKAKEPQIVITNTTDHERIGTLETQLQMIKRENTELRRATNRMTYNDTILPRLSEQNAKLFINGVIPELTRRIGELSHRVGTELGTVGKPYAKELDAWLRFFNEKPQKGGNFIALGDTFFPHEMTK